MSKAEMHVPLSEVRGVPTFLSWENLQRWLADHKVDVQEDWGGRPSVDLPTAWRLKAEADADAARIEAEQRKRQEHDAAVQAATQELKKIREDTFAEASNRIGTTFLEADSQAWAAVAEAVKKLPKDVASQVMLPQGMHMQFG